MSPRTGHHCPETGWWQPVDQPGVPRPIHEGEVMPPVYGLQVRWEPAAMPDINSRSLSATSRERRVTAAASDL